MNKMCKMEKMKKVIKHTSEKLQIILKNNGFEMVAILFCVMVLYDVIFSGPVHDDAVYYYLHGAEVCEDKSFWQLLWESLVGQIRRGRFFPLSVHAYFVYYLVYDNYILYKFAILVAVCINVWQFGLFVDEVYDNKRIKILAMISLPAFFQVYNTYHNALLGYHLFMQIMVFFLLQIMVHLYRFEKKGRKGDLVQVVCWTVLSMLTYEIGFIYAAMCFAVLLFSRRQKKNKIFNLCWIAGPTALMATCNLIVKKMYVVEYEGISVSFSILAIFKTWFIQLINAIPFTHVLFSRGDGNLPQSMLSFWAQIDTHIILTLILFIVIYVKLNKEFPQTKNENNTEWGMVASAFLAYLGVGFLIALTQKYQNELYLGVSHISVYIEYFLLLYVIIAIVLSVANWWSSRSGKKIKEEMFVKDCIYIIIMVLALSTNMICTKISVSSINSTIKYRMVAVEEAIKKGLLEGIPEGSTIVVMENDVWLSNAFLAEFSGKKFQVVFENDFWSDPNCTSDENSDVYLLRFGANEGEKLVIMGEQARIDEEGKLICAGVRLYTNYYELNKIYFETADGVSQRVNYGETNVLYNDWKNIMLECYNDIQFNSVSINWGAK